jgi:hypothetical protein
MRSRQVLRGSLRWLTPEEGGLRQPFASDHWYRPGWVEPGDIEHVASLVIEGIEPGLPVSPRVTAFWLAWERLPDEDWTVVAGDVLAITEGVKPVAYLSVEAVAADDT